MLRSRVIPCLLIQNKGLIKTVKFKDPKYVGDPINAVKIFNEKEVDELIVIDINASSHSYEPDYSLIKRIAQECRMPLCYGGGIKTIDQARKIISLGVEKVAISSAALENPKIIKDLSLAIGRQSVVVVIDCKKNFLGNYSIFIQNGKNKLKLNLINALKCCQEAGAGEILINSIDNDGKMAGYDLNLARIAHNNVDVPLTIMGGAGTKNDIINLINEFKLIGAAAGSLFVFKGKYKAVLINYISLKDRSYLKE